MTCGGRGSRITPEAVPLSGDPVVEHRLSLSFTPPRLLTAVTWRFWEGEFTPSGTVTDSGDGPVPVLCRHLFKLPSKTPNLGEGGLSVNKWRHNTVGNR